MKKMLLIFSFNLMLSLVNAQLSGRYVADFRKNVEYSINFLNDGHYYIDMVEHLTNDVLDKRIMSIGHYSTDGEEVTLIDKIHNFRMELVFVNDSLNMKKSFRFIKGKSFGFRSSYVDKYTLNWLSDYDSVSVEKERKKYKTQNQKIYKLIYGNYFSSGCLQCAFEYRVTILRDNTYLLYFQDLLISEGTFTREGVELILIDKWLNQRFYLMIGKRVLISKLLPGDYESSILQRYP
ncbi:MAG: hypothetical protein IPH69_05435 [Bacteroidales bacterium]|nr:hypothetical protein [Bacteroidales bacterium]